MMMIGFLRMKAPTRTTTMNAMATAFVLRNVTMIAILFAEDWKPNC